MQKAKELTEEEAERLKGADFLEPAKEEKNGESDQKKLKPTKKAK